MSVAKGKAMRSPDVRSRAVTDGRLDERRVAALKEDLDTSYREMANDEAHESEALEWVEAIIGDVSATSED